MKVLATGPLVGCAGADPSSSLPGDSGGTGSTAIDGSGAVASAGKATTSAGSPSGGSGLTGGSSSAGGASGGNAFTSNGGSASGGNAFTSNGGAAAGFSFSTGGSAAGTGTSAGAAGTSGSPSNPNSLVAAGNVSAIAVGGLIVVAGIFLMGRDAKGIYVMSMQCTHKGCALVFSGAQLDCPCHHSRFDSNGNVLVGPATAPLPHLALFVDAGGNITVDRYTVVSSSMRTPV